MATEERNRILGMVETGQVSASQAAQLLDTLSTQAEPHAQNHTLRIWVSDTSSRRSKTKMTATLPVPLVSLSLRMLSRFAPQLNENTVQHIIQAIERGATGRVLDVQDLEEGKRLEIFVEP
ncbi:MAG: SHOCT-like domain-containing protein [Ktedonobacteraceae bacterium]